MAAFTAMTVGFGLRSLAVRTLPLSTGIGALGGVFRTLVSQRAYRIGF